jgi:hypothetical protein
MEITNYLTECIVNHTPVSFSKYGDGEFNCMFHPYGHNGDNDQYTQKLSNKLLDSFKYMVNESNNGFIGLWHDYNNKPILEQQVNKEVKWAKYQSIYIDHHSDNKDKVQLIKAVQDSTVKKIIICNPLLIKSKILLKTDFEIYVPFNNWFDTDFEKIIDIIKQNIIDNEKHIIITCCGMSAKCIIAECTRLFENGIYLDFGSALDFICTKKDSRGWSTFFTYEYLIDLFQDILPEDWNDSKYDYIYKEAKQKLGVHLPK